MKKIFMFAILFCAAFALANTPAYSASICSRVIKLRSASPTSRGERIIYKSNWNGRAGREQTIWEGNHSQKGAGFLVHYRSGLFQNSFSLQVRDLNCRVIGSMGRFPRCTRTGCGEHERWYFRTVGGTKDSIPSIAAKARKSGKGNSVLVQLRNNTWAQIQNVYDNREVF